MTPAETLVAQAAQEAVKLLDADGQAAVHAWVDSRERAACASAELSEERRERARWAGGWAGGVLTLCAVLAAGAWHFKMLEPPACPVCEACEVCETPELATWQSLQYRDNDSPAVTYGATSTHACVTLDAAVLCVAASPASTPPLPPP